MSSDDKELAAWLKSVPKNPCAKSMHRTGERLEKLDTLHKALKSFVWKTGLDHSITQQNMDVLEALDQLDE